VVTLFKQLSRIEESLRNLTEKNEQIQRPNNWVRVGRLNLNANWLGTLSPIQTAENYLYRNINKAPVLLTDITLHFQLISNPFAADRPDTPDPDAYIRHLVTLRTRHNTILDAADYCVLVEWFPISESAAIFWGAAVMNRLRDEIKPNLIIEPDDFIWGSISADQVNDAYLTFPKINASITTTVTNYKEPRY